MHREDTVISSYVYPEAVKTFARLVDLETMPNEYFIAKIDCYTARTDVESRLDYLKNGRDRTGGTRRK